MLMYNSFTSIHWLKIAQLRAQHGTLIINILWVRKSLHQFIICLKWIKKEKLFYEKDEVFVFIFQRLLNLQEIPSNESCEGFGFREQTTLTNTTFSLKMQMLLHVWFEFTRQQQILFHPKSNSTPGIYEIDWVGVRRISTDSTHYLLMGIFQQFRPIEVRT